MKKYRVEILVAAFGMVMIFTGMSYWSVDYRNRSIQNAHIQHENKHSRLGAVGVPPGWPDPLSQVTMGVRQLPIGDAGDIFDYDRTRNGWTNSQNQFVPSVSNTNTEARVLKDSEGRDFWSLIDFDVAPDRNQPIGSGIFKVRMPGAATAFTIRVRGTNIFITTTNEVSCDQFWGPDDKYEIKFWKKEEAK